MTGPYVTPDDGIARYACDHTQGPACAIACAAGTIWRNYLMPLAGRQGQSAVHQMDTSADLGRVLGNADGRLWRMRNGYLLPHDGTLPAITQAIAQLGAAQLSGQLRVGLQADTEVTIAPSGHGVSQVYCSALPVAYTQHPAAEWEPFARLVLQAAYEASLHIAMQMANTARPRLFLTRLGGGAFGNPQDWITDSMRAALLLFRHRDIDVTIVSHARADPRNAPLLAMFT